MAVSPLKMTPSVQRYKFGEGEIVIETGRVAKQASGAVTVSYGDTVLLVTAVASGTASSLGFMPLTVEYQEKMYASGRIPGGFFKREGRPAVHEILRSRIVDRTIRPLFPDGWNFETQILPVVHSYGGEIDPAVLALVGASYALTLSDIPFNGPVAAVRVGRVGGQLIANPTKAQQAESDVDLIISASREAIVMVEGGAQFVPESVIVDALVFGFESCQPVIAAQLEWQATLGQPKRAFAPPARNEAFAAKVRELAWDKLATATRLTDKIERYGAYKTVKSEVSAALAGGEFDDATLAKLGDELEAIKTELVRTRIVKEGTRIDGRTTTEVRDIDIALGYLPRTHGSSLFTRGETQGIVTVTLGTKEDEQRIESLDGTAFKKFLLHYNFPPYSVGEVKRVGSPGRREIGHGALAERALQSIVPTDDPKFPYTIRIVSEITESNGSSSMATVCGGSLALFDAGVPVRSPVAGVAMGLIKEGADVAVLTDILGDEDHLGDMDFKVCGNDEGVSALQMDIKIAGVTREILTQALNQARDGRLHILGKMKAAISAPRDEMSEFAPRITTLKIKVDRIRDVIGPGGKIIRDIVARTGCSINVEDDGTIQIASTDRSASDKAVKIIQDLTQEAEVNKTYLGTVVKTTDFGAFVEILPGIEGLVHISELDPKRVEQVTDIVQQGDEIVVKVLGIDRQGKIRLSRKEALADREAAKRAIADKPE
jgi:polyribonucleotide nucleotidyltransferase